MQHLRIKILELGSPDGRWELVGLDEFVTRHSPGLGLIVACTKQFPPLHILNLELATGGADLGMSGGCYWKPFQLTEKEYHDLYEEMLTSPLYDLEYDEHLEDRGTLKKWIGAVISHHNPRDNNE
jgi:hypothetical protein